MTRPTTTICWGVVLALSPLLPRSPIQTAPTHPSVPVSRPFEFGWTATLNPPGRAALLATADHLVISNIGGAMSALDPSTGNVVWANDATKAEVAPAAGEGLIFIGGEGRLRALSETTGAQKWADVDASLTPTVPVWRAGWLLAQTTTGLRAYRAADGALIWKKADVGGLSGPLAIDGDLAFAIAGRKILAIALPTGDTRWTIALDTDASDLLAAHERVYFAGADGALHCLRQRDGRALWAKQTHTGIVGRPVTDEASVYFVSLDNRLTAVERYGGNQRWKAKLDARPTPGLAIANGRVVVPLTTGDLSIHLTKTGQRAGVLPVVQTSGTAGENASKLEAMAVTESGEIVRLTTSPGDVQTLIAYRAATFHVQPAASLPGTELDLFGAGPPRLRP